MVGWPLQLIVVGLGRDSMPQGLLDQLRASRASGVIHLIDGGLLRKGDEGELSMRPAPGIQLDDSPFAGWLAGWLFGCGAGGGANAWLAELNPAVDSERQIFGLSADELAEIADAIPRSSDVLVLLIEHRWDAGFVETAEVEGGMLLAQGAIALPTLLEVGGSSHAGGAAAPNTSLEE